MFITKTEQDIDTLHTRGKVSITFEVDEDNPEFISDEAVEDPILVAMIDDFLKITAAFITNVLHFYKKSPVLATYVLGGAKQIMAAQNKYFRQVSKDLPKE
jgi:hypothetical protein